MMKRKYVMMGGYAFSEESDMKKLKNLAKQGWVLDGVSLPILSYRFKKGEPHNLDFAIDYQKEVDEDYFSMFEAAGWKHEVTIGDEIHLFSAPEGTQPIYTDRGSEFDRLESIAKDFRIPGLCSLALFTMMMVINIIGVTSPILHYAVLTGTVLSVVALIFTGMPYLGYQYRLRKMRRC